MKNTVTIFFPEEAGGYIISKKDVAMVIENRLATQSQLELPFDPPLNVSFTIIDNCQTNQ